MSEADCQKVIDGLYQMLDGEMEDGDCAQLQAHIDRCSDCLQRMGVEQQFRVWLKVRCSGDEAPSQLIDSIRSALESEGAS